MLEIQEAVNDATGTNLPTLHGLVLQNLTVESLEPYFKHQLCAIDYHLELDYGGYDTIYQDSLNETLLHDDTIDFILLILWLPSFSKLLYEDFSSATPTDINNEITRINHFIENVIANIRKHNNAPVLLFNFTQPYAPALGIYEQSTPHSQFAAIRTPPPECTYRAREVSCPKTPVFRVYSPRSCKYRRCIVSLCIGTSGPGCCRSFTTAQIHITVVLHT